MRYNINLISTSNTGSHNHHRIDTRYKTTLHILDRTNNGWTTITNNQCIIHNNISINLNSKCSIRTIRWLIHNNSFLSNSNTWGSNLSCKCSNSMEAIPLHSYLHSSQSNRTDTFPFSHNKFNLSPTTIVHLMSANKVTIPP
jgi:hypothetical protein